MGFLSPEMVQIWDTDCLIKKVLGPNMIVEAKVKTRNTLILPICSLTVFIDIVGMLQIF